MGLLSYQAILQRSFEDRQALNPRYCRRHFAQDLGMAPSSLSEVMRGKKGLSGKKAAVLSKTLGLPDWESQLFCDLVVRDRGRSFEARKAARRRLSSQSHERKIELLKARTVEALTSWVDLAILEATHVKGFVPSESWLAEKLAVGLEVVKEASKRLVTVGLLKIHPDGHWEDLSPLFTTSDGIPSEQIRRLHTTLLRLAETKMHNSALEDRTLKSAIFSLSQEQFPQAKMILNQAIERVIELAETGAGPKDQVVCFSAQLFLLLKGAS